MKDIYQWKAINISDLNRSSEDYSYNNSFGYIFTGYGSFNYWSTAKWSTLSPTSFVWTSDSSNENSVSSNSNNGISDSSANFSFNLILSIFVMLISTL